MKSIGALWGGDKYEFNHLELLNNLYLIVNNTAANIIGISPLQCRFRHRDLQNIFSFVF